MILKGHFDGLAGVQVPVIPQIYEPMLAELGRLGICMTEKIETV